MKNIQKAIKQLSRLKGKSKKKISQEEYEKVRREVFEDLEI